MSEQLFKSNAELKRMERVAEQAAFLEKKRKQAILERWEQAQITAAGWQSVLDHAKSLYTEHKEELEEEVITKTEEMIKERQSEIEQFVMTEKDLYLAAMGAMAD